MKTTKKALQVMMEGSGLRLVLGEYDMASGVRRRSYYIDSGGTCYHETEQYG